MEALQLKILVNNIKYVGTDIEYEIRLFSQIIEKKK